MTIFIIVLIGTLTISILVDLLVFPQGKKASKTMCEAMCESEAMCEHLLGSINPKTKMRVCLRCRAEIPAEGTFQVIKLEGNLEVYPASVFAQWTDDQKRKFLNIRKGDMLLHNWDSNSLYVFRGEGT